MTSVAGAQTFPLISQFSLYLSETLFTNLNKNQVDEERRGGGRQRGRVERERRKEGRKERRGGGKERIEIDHRNMS